VTPQLRELKRRLKTFGVSSCHVRRRNIISFSAQKWTDDDPLVPRDTMLFFHYPDESAAERWAARELDRTTGVHGAACRAPEERWVFVSDDGHVYVMGQGDDGAEKPVGAKLQINAVKSIGGFAYVVGAGRAVFRRTGPNRWLRLSDAAMARGEPDALGFDDIDGFSERDVYACGGRGHLWSFDGHAWRRRNVPTDRG
jgi:hypothetical protein